MPATRPIQREPKSVMDREQDKLFALSIRSRRDDAFSTQTRQFIAIGFEGTRVGGSTQVSGGTVG